MGLPLVPLPPFHEGKPMSREQRIESVKRQIEMLEKHNARISVCLALFNGVTVFAAAMLAAKLLLSVGQ